ncbi:hypothetical protein Tco_1317826 [Tanacetum coccineum]
MESVRCALTIGMEQTTGEEGQDLSGVRQTRSSIPLIEAESCDLAPILALPKEGEDLSYTANSSKKCLGAVECKEKRLEARKTMKHQSEDCWRFRENVSRRKEAILVPNMTADIATYYQQVLEPVQRSPAEHQRQFEFVGYNTRDTSINGTISRWIICHEAS